MSEHLAHCVAVALRVHDCRPVIKSAPHADEHAHSADLGFWGRSSSRGLHHRSPSPWGHCGHSRTEQPAWACSPQCSWSPSWGEPCPASWSVPACLHSGIGLSWIAGLRSTAPGVQQGVPRRATPRSTVFLSRLDIGRSMPGLGMRSARPARTWRLLRAPAPQEVPSQPCPSLAVLDSEAGGTPTCGLGSTCWSQLGSCEGRHSALLVYKPL